MSSFFGRSKKKTATEEPEVKESAADPAVVRTRQDAEARRGANIITGPNGQATAAEDYKEHCAHELTIKTGEKVNIIQYTEDPKWAMARSANGRKGLVPISHFERAPAAAQDAMQVYLGNIPKPKAEEMLRTDPYADGKFLIRENQQYQGDLTLSVGFSDRESGAQKFAHYRIARDEKGMHYVCEEKKFTSVRQLIDYYNTYQSGLVAKLGIWFKGNQTKCKKKGGLHAAIERTAVQCESEIGKGHFGKTYKGRFQNNDAAIKILHNRSAENAVVDEGGRLASLEHPNVVRYYGFVQDEIIWVVMEYCSKGNLKELLKSDGSSYTPDKLSKFMSGTANGMAHLEGEGVIHRNLRCTSLLVTGNEEIKVSDYGFGTKEDIQMGIRHATKWTAPEAYAQHKYTSKSDVWSFGVVIYEVFSYGKEPYEGMTSDDVFTKVFRDGERLSPPSECTGPWSSVMPQCFHLDANKRPGFGNIKSQGAGSSIQE